MVPEAESKQRVGKTLQTKIQSLTDYLARQNDIFQQLIQLAEAKKRSIIIGQVEELDQCLRQESSLLSDLERLEEARFTLQQDMAARLNIAVEEITASFLLQLASQQYPASAPALEKELDRLQSSLSRLQEQIRENSELLKQSLNYIDEMYYLLNPEDSTGVYSEQGTTEEAGKNIRIIDKKA